MIPNMRTLPSILILLTTTVSTSFSQDLETILENHYKAAALDKMQQVESIITEGKNTFMTGGIESEFKVYHLKPDKLRAEGNQQGAEVIQTYNGKSGWVYAPSMGMKEPKEIKGIELESLLSPVVFESPLWNYKEKGSSLSLALPVEGDNHHHLILAPKEGTPQHIYIDQESHLIARVRSSQSMGEAEKEMEVAVEKYKSFKGIPFPVKVVTRIDGQVVTTTYVDKVVLNKNLDPSLFEKPLPE